MLTSILALALLAAPAHREAPLAPQRSPLLARAADLGRAASAEQLSLSIYLRLRDPEGAERYAFAVQDPKAPEHHQFLAPAEFEARFGASAADEGLVRDHLSRAGLLVSPRRGQHLQATGSVAKIERAFGVAMHRYQLDGASFLAADREPLLPPGVASRVLHIAGLAGAAGHLHPRGLSGPQLSTAYDFAGLAASGNSGAGQTVAIYELAPYYHRDIDTFASRLGIPLNGTVGPGPQITDVVIDGSPVDCTSGDCGGAEEVELDMEIVLELAPGAAQRVYMGPNTDQGSLDVLSAIVSDNLSPVMSISWGDCEAHFSTSNQAAQHQVLIQAAAAGISPFASSGDSGATDCGDSTLAVDSPASDPFTTGVGGTTLTLNGSNAINSETAWGGSGGGISTVYPMPPFQANSTVAGVHGSYSNGFRQVPDISANANPATGYSVYEPFCTAPAGTACSSHNFVTVGGTSGASPLWAATWTLVTGQVGERQPANESLYALAALSHPPLHDITHGSNGGGGFSAGVGYDPVTGLGSPDVDALATTLAGSGAGALVANPTPLSFGQVPSVGASSKTLSITNGGSASIGLTGFTFAGADAARFSISDGPTTLAAGQATTLHLTFTPSGTAVARAVLQIATDASFGASTLSVPVDAEPSSTSLRTAPAQLSFGVGRIGAAAIVKTLDISNQGSSAVSITSSAFTGDGSDFRISSSALAGTSVPAGGSISVSVAFAPTAHGARSASLILHAADGDLGVALSGSGAAADPQLTTTLLAFGTLFQGDHKTISLQVENQGDADLHLTLDAAAPFTATNPGTIAPGGTGTVAVTFTAGNAVADTTLHLGSADGDVPPVSVALTAKGVAPTISTSPATLDFGQVPLAGVPTKLAVILADTAGVPFSLAAALTGADAGDFVINATSLSLTATGTLNYVVSFAPTVGGLRTASLTFSRNGVTVATVALTGTASTPGGCASGGEATLGSCGLLALLWWRRRASGRTSTTAAS